MLNNRIIHQIWVGDRLPPPHIQQFMQTVRDVNPSFEYKLWDEKAFEDAGIDIHQFDVINPHPAGFCGGLRLVIIERFGGIYLDCDMECIKPLGALLQHEAFAAPQDHRLCNAAFGAMPGHPWLKWQLNETNNIPRSDPTWNVLLMDRAPRGGVTVLPKETFYPWLWHVPKESRKITDDTLAIHHWDGSWAKH